LALTSHKDSICFKKFFEVIAEQIESYPTHILADGAYSITNAAASTFPDAIRLMCWAHVVKNIDQKLKSLEPETKMQIRKDIQALQFAMNEEQFRNSNFLIQFICILFLVATLLMQKWADDFDEDDVHSFIDYLSSTWIESAHFRWFEGNYLKLLFLHLLILGASIYPNTNNALESNNKQIKDSHSLRDRLPFNKFVIWAEKMIQLDWSAGRSKPNEVNLKNPPHLFVSARQLHDSKRKIFILTAGENFGISSNEQMGLSSNQVKKAARLLNSYELDSFDAYIDSRFKVSISYLNFITLF
jgi:hypothetical protein